MSNILRLCFIGYGEVGQLFARQLAAKPGIAISAYDLKLGSDEDARPLREIASKDNVRLGTSAADAAKGATIIISAVTASSAEAVAFEAAGYLTPDQTLFDLNSASPTTKARCASMLEAKGLEYVEGAVMAPVAELGISVSTLVGGKRAQAVVDSLVPLGFTLKAVSNEIGRASATKLCRSIMIKGIEALIIDSARASKHWGVSDDVFASLDASFPGTDWEKLAETMDKRVARHGIRRAAEMREAAVMLREMGLEPGLSEAIADAHQRRAEQGKP